MKFSEFIKHLFSSPLKIIAKVVLYFAKIFMYCIYWLVVGLAVEFIQNSLLYDIAIIVGAYGFFTVWTYFERLKNSDAETDYTEKLDKKAFSFSYEIKDVLHNFKWNILLETFVFYIVLTLFMPIIVQLDQTFNIMTISAFAAYILQPVFNVIIWVAVRKKWHGRYRRWARHKKTQSFVDDSAPDDNDLDERI